MGASLFLQRVNGIPAGSRPRFIATAIILLAILVTIQTASGSDETGDILVLVNGETITAADMDALVMKAHRAGNMDQSQAPDFRKLLEKRIKDLLILQDAWAMGMAEEPQVLTDVDEKMTQRAVRAYVGDNLVQPAAANRDSVLAYFNRYYRRIQIRILTAGTREEAEDLRGEVLQGGDMDALAREHSVDSKKSQGGLFPLMHWADLENVYRDQVRPLETAAISPVFPLNQVFACVRVEKRQPADPETLATYDRRISAIILDRERKQAWDDFIDQLRQDVGLVENMEPLARVIADSTLMATAAFLKDDPEPVAELADGTAVTGTDLRQAISHEAMNNMQAGFPALFENARRVLLRDLILENRAREAGYFEDPELLAQRRQDLEDAVIQQYLAETIAPRVVFNRAEFEEFYEANMARFQGPTRVRLAMLIVDTQDEADDVAGRLAGGGDFTRIYKEYMKTDSGPPESKFIGEDQLSADIRMQLADMEPGDTSDILTLGTGWMVFRLEGRQPGQVPPLEEVEMDIRKVMFQRKFNQLMDMHFATLAGQSEIIRHEDRIEAYFNPGAEGK